MSDEKTRILAEEQAALRRVATLVASGGAPEEVFVAVTEEVGRLLPVDFADLSRYEPDGTITMLATWGITVGSLPSGARLKLGGKNLSTVVAETGASARIESYADASGPIGDAVRSAGVRSVVGTPIIVDGRVWGMVAAGSSMDKPLPADAEARLASFTQLLATAVANAESRARLSALAQEQAALRRLATLVARGTPTREVFAAVVDEVGQLLPVDVANLGRYESDGAITSLAAWSRTGSPLPPVGSPWTLEGSAVGAPITVAGRLWGVIGAGSRLEQPLPPDTEARLASFTELVATAIANTESRAGLARLAEEQAALRRVATLVAGEVAPEDVFAAVTEEVGQLLPVDFAILGRYEGDGTGTAVAVWGDPAARFPVGSRWSLEGNNLATRVFETGRPARSDRYADASGPIGVTGRESGFRSGVGTPITVEGRRWGVIVAGSNGAQPLPADTEARLGSFTELVATAIANAEGRAGLARLAEEQAALRRIATLVAHGTPPEELFAAVTEEVARLLPVDFAHMGRYEPDRTITVLATSGNTAAHFPVGRRWELGGKNLTTIVFETGQPGRIDDYADAVGPLGITGRALGIRSSAGTPIIVEGHVWGVVIAGTTVEQPLPPDIEARLGSFTELVATAIANAESRAELTASRARIVAAADESRRRIERDLHDGAQQRLVHAVITLKLALRELSNGAVNADELVAEALEHAEQANSELRELAHGILPAALTRGGLRAGVEALVSRVSLPVGVDVCVERLPPGLEATAYFFVCEALTNVVKHARADAAQVTACIEHGELRVEVRDNGVGGARGGDRTGLGGLEDRVSALAGRLMLESPPGEGTRVCAFLPLASEP